jgi:hypothetical protein
MHQTDPNKKPVHEVVTQRWKGLVPFLCTRVQALLCTSVIPVVSYMLTGLARCSVDPGISCGARKLTRTPRIIKKKKKKKAGTCTYVTQASKNYKNLEHVNLNHLLRRTCVSFFFLWPFGSFPCSSFSCAQNLVLS